MWIVCFPEFLDSLVFYFRIIRGQRKEPTSFFVIHISPAYFEQPTLFAHIAFINCTFSLHFNIQQSACEVSPDEFLAFKNRITDLTS